jgi:hypothetical protein
MMNVRTLMLGLLVCAGIATLAVAFVDTAPKGGDTPMGRRTIPPTDVATSRGIETATFGLG